MWAAAAANTIVQAWHTELLSIGQSPHQRDSSQSLGPAVAHPPLAQATQSGKGRGTEELVLAWAAPT